MTASLAVTARGMNGAGARQFGGKMKKRDMIELLKDLPDDADIAFAMIDGCCGERLELEVEENMLEAYGGFAFITFSALPGYRSCLQSGTTKRLDEEYWMKYNPELLKPR